MTKKVSDTPLAGAQTGKPDVRKAGRLRHDPADHDSLAGSGSGQGSAHRTSEAGGDRAASGSGPAIANKQARDYVEPAHFKDDPAGLHTQAGSGVTPDHTEFAKFGEHVDQKGKAGADVADGAMVAWGGMTKTTGYGKKSAGSVDIEKPGYPMDGEPTSKGHQPTDHVDG